MDEEPAVASDPAEIPIERFARLYGTPERGARLWAQWMKHLEPASVALMEKLAVDHAAQNGLTEEEGRTYLALQKLIQDRGYGFVEQFLREYDNKAAAPVRSLKPMPQTRRRR